MAVTIGSVTEGNANAEEIKNNSPDSELYEKNKKYLQGSLVKFNDKIYLAKRNVPSDVDLDNPYYWEIFMDAADSKRVDELFEKTGNLDELKTESKDTLVAAINEAVLYTAQSLTEEEQAQARANIGAQNLYNGLTPVSYSCTDGTYSVSDTVYLESGNIISPTDTVSNDVRIAFRYINLWSIPTQLDYWKDDIKKYKLLIDNGYLENNTIWYSKPDKKLKKQIRFGTHSTLGNYIIFNFNYDYEVIGQLVYYVDTDTISTGTDTYLNHNLKRDKNNVLSYSAIKLSSDPTEPMQIATKQYVDNAITNIPATDLSNCVQTDKENILGDNGSIISNSSRGNNLTISNGVIEQKNGNQDTVSLGDAKVVFSHDNDGSSSTKGSGTFTMYGRKGEEYFKFKGTNGDVRVSGIATPTLSNDAVNKGYVDLQIANIEIPTVPTNVSAFTNDAGYLTAVPSEYITETELNAKGYLTEHQSLADYALKSEIPSPYSLPTASATALGGIKVGAGLAIADDGTLSMNIASAAVGQIIKVKAIDASGKPTAWEAVDMQSGGGHWETVLDTVWEQDVINPTAFDSETGIFTCAEGELNNLELNKEYIFYQQCAVKGVAYNTILNTDKVNVTKLSDTTFSINNVTPPTTFVPTNVKFSKGACLAITDIDAKKIRLTLDGQFHATATDYDKPFFGIPTPYFAANTGYQQILNAYQAYQQVTAEVESPYRIVGQILCGFNAPSSNGNFHFKNNSFCCPLVPAEFSEGDSNFSSDGTKIAKLYSAHRPWLGVSNANSELDYLKIISGTKVKLERWVE